MSSCAIPPAGGQAPRGVWKASKWEIKLFTGKKGKKEEKKKEKGERKKGKGKKPGTSGADGRGVIQMEHPASHQQHLPHATAEASVAFSSLEQAKSVVQDTNSDTMRVCINHSPSVSCLASSTGSCSFVLLLQAHLRRPHSAETDDCIHLK